LKRVLQKNEENESGRKILDLQIRFRSFFAQDSSTEVTELATRSPKFPEKVTDEKVARVDTVRAG
jgi:hypothetical protein